MADDLAAVLSQTLAYVRSSQHDGWSQTRSNSQVAEWLAEMIDESQRDPAAIRLAFAPTGVLQELAMANGWSEEYLRLSSRADALLGHA